MKNIFICLAVIFAVLLICGTCYCDDASQDTRTFRGQVKDIDWVGSLLTVDGGDVVTFYVPPSIKIRYGTGVASLEDIEQEDYVLIEYTGDLAGTPKVVRMSLNKSYPEF